MIRAVLEEGGLFLVPFVAFALVLALLRRRVVHPESWTGPAAWLVLAGLVLVAAGVVGSALLRERHTGGYVPPHLDGQGRPVPGGFE